MEIMEDFFAKRKLKKLEKYKNKYIDEIKKNYTNICQGEMDFPDIQKLQEYIKRNNIPLIDSSSYGDKFDALSSIFSNNNFMQDTIQRKRKDDINNLIENISQMDINYNVINSVELEKLVLQVERYYKVYVAEQSVDESKKKFIDSLNGNDQSSKLVNLFSKIYDADIDIHTDFTTRIVRDYSQVVSESILNNQSIFKKYDEYLLGLETIKAITNNNETVITNFNNMLRSSEHIEVSEFFTKIHSISKLREYGIEDENISFIDVNRAADVSKAEQERFRLIKEKQNQYLDEKDFALIRSTEYFPYNREFDTVDEKNGRGDISNFLTQALYNREMKSIYGENWLEIYSRNETIAYFNNNTEGITDKEIEEAQKFMESSKKIMNKFELPGVFCRSTKHFTLNGLVSSHMYGNFEGNPYIFIEPLEEHIGDTNLVNLAAQDTFFELDRGDKKLILSDKCKLLMPVHAYKEVIKDPDLRKQIESYDLTLFEGDEKKAVEMKLTELGYVSQDIGMHSYVTNKGLDEERDFTQKMLTSIKNIAKINDINIGVHYQSEYQQKDNQKTEYLNEQINEDFNSKFSTQFNIDKSQLEKLSREEIDRLIDSIGEDDVKAFLQDYKYTKEKELNEVYSEYEENRKGIKDHKSNVGGDMTIE